MSTRPTRLVRTPRCKSRRLLCCDDCVRVGRVFVFRQYQTELRRVPFASLTLGRTLLRSTVVFVAQEIVLCASSLASMVSHQIRQPPATVPRKHVLPYPRQTTCGVPFSMNPVQGTSYRPAFDSPLRRVNCFGIPPPRHCRPLIRMSPTLKPHTAAREVSKVQSSSEPLVLSKCTGARC